MAEGAGAATAAISALGSDRRTGSGTWGNSALTGAGVSTFGAGAGAGASWGFMALRVSMPVPGSSGFSTLVEPTSSFTFVVTSSPGRVSK